MRKKTIYLLEIKGDDWTVIGAFSTREKAEKAWDSRPCQFVDLHLIQEVVVDNFDPKVEFPKCVGQIGRAHV